MVGERRVKGKSATKWIKEREMDFGRWKERKRRRRAKEKRGRERDVERVCVLLTCCTLSYTVCLTNWNQSEESEELCSFWSLNDLTSQKHDVFFPQNANDDDCAISKSNFLPSIVIVPNYRYSYPPDTRVYIRCVCCVYLILCTHSHTYVQVVNNLFRVQKSKSLHACQSSSSGLMMIE